MDRIKEDLLKIEDVYSIEDLNVWSLTAGKTNAIVHLQLGKLLYSIISDQVQLGWGKQKPTTFSSLSSLYSHLSRSRKYHSGGKKTTNYAFVQ